LSLDEDAASGFGKGYSLDRIAELFLVLPLPLSLGGEGRVRGLEMAI